MDSEETYDELLTSYKKGKDIGTVINFVSGLNGIQFVFYTFYVSAILLQYGSPPFFYGFYDYQITTNPPGTFVDRRYSFFWVMSFLQITRLLLFSFFQLCATKTTYRRWIFEIHRFLNIFYIIFDVIYLLIMYLGYGFNCNSGILPENPCNSQYYCKFYANVQPTVCKATEYDASFDISNLNTNLVFIMERVTTIAFLIMDVLQLILASELRICIVRYIVSNLEK